MSSWGSYAREAKAALNIDVGIVGLGMISESHIRGFLGVSNVRIVAVCDVLPERAQAVADRLGATPYTDYRALLAHPGLQAVSVCTPPFAHREIVVAAAHAGLHVLCEKPLAVTATDSRAMVEACEAAGVKLGVCSARVGRLRGSFRAARTAIHTGKLGQVYHARYSAFRVRGRPGLDFYKNAPWFLNSAQAGGGALYDMGCYDIDLLLYLLGSPRPLTVSAHAYRGFPGAEGFDKPFDVDEHVTVFVRFEGGVSLVLERGWATNIAYERDELRIFGNQAALTGPTTLTWAEEGKIQQRALPVYDREGHAGIFGDFAAAIRHDRSPATPGRDGQKVMEILSGALLSSRLGREVSVSEVYQIEALRALQTPGWPTDARKG